MLQCIEAWGATTCKVYGTAVAPSSDYLGRLEAIGAFEAQRTLGNRGIYDGAKRKRLQPHGVLLVCPDLVGVGFRHRGATPLCCCRHSLASSVWRCSELKSSGATSWKSVSEEGAIRT